MFSFQSNTVFIHRLKIVSLWIELYGFQFQEKKNISQFFFVGVGLLLSDRKKKKKGILKALP